MFLSLPLHLVNEACFILFLKEKVVRKEECTNSVCQGQMTFFLDSKHLLKVHVNSATLTFIFKSKLLDFCLQNT